MVRNKILQGDSTEVLRGFEDESISHTVTDPPYGLGTKEPTPEEIEAFLAGHEGLKTGDFMGKKWDIPSVDLWREVYRVMKPGGLLAAFAGTRTLDLMAAGIEAAGFRYLGTMGWIHCLTEETEVLTREGWVSIVSALEGLEALCYYVDQDTFSWETISKQYIYRYEGEVVRLHGNRTDHRVTPEHRVLVLSDEGHHEFRLAGELQGGVNIPTLEDIEGALLGWDRVDVTREPYRGLVGCVTTPTGTFVARQKGQPFVTGNSQGFPKSLNVGKGIQAYKQTGKSDSSVTREGARDRENLHWSKFPKSKRKDIEVTSVTDEDAKKWDGWGTALKPAFEPILMFVKGETDWIMPVVPFCYSAKAAKSERHADGEVDNNHVTVKPLRLMKWLVQEVARPGELCLDPFVGSGTTAAACAEEGRDYVGIERDPHYFEIASKRVEIYRTKAETEKNTRDLFDLAMSLGDEDA